MAEQKLREQIAAGKGTEQIVDENAPKVADKQDNVIDIDDIKKRLEAAEAAKKVSDDELQKERNKRVATENENKELSKKFSASEVEKINATERDLTSNLTVATGNIEAIKRELKDAYTAQTPDADKIVELNEKLADARLDLREATRTKQSFDAWKEKQKEVQATKPATNSVPQHVYSDSDKDWISKHPRFNTDDEYREVVEGAHNGALRKGIAVSSVAYYQYIESRLKQVGLEKDADNNGDDDDGRVEEKPAPVIEAPKKKVTSAPAAPVSYNAPSSNGNGPRKGKVSLSPEQQKHAIHQFGKNSMHKLSDADALARYASYL